MCFLSFLWRGMIDGMNAFVSQGMTQRVIERFTYASTYTALLFIIVNLSRNVIPRLGLNELT